MTFRHRNFGSYCVAVSPPPPSRKYALNQNFMEKSQISLYYVASGPHFLWQRRWCTTKKRWTLFKMGPHWMQALVILFASMNFSFCNSVSSFCSSSWNLNIRDTMSWGRAARTGWGIASTEPRAALRGLPNGCLLREVEDVLSVRATCSMWILCDSVLLLAVTSRWVVCVCVCVCVCVWFSWLMQC
jgi:hypothetical protein